MSIMGHAELALDEIPPLSPACENLSKVIENSQRAAELCGEMLAYAGKGKIEQTSMSLLYLIEETLNMLQTCISKKAILNLNLDKELPYMHGDPAQIRQILMNLVINASDAIGDHDGTITITTGSMECSEKHLENDYIVASSKPGTYIYIEVSDTGCGMNKKTIDRIFDPFFTTKFAGRGLGLSALMGIVNSHEAALKVCSEPGKGTTFKVLFPAIAVPEQKESEALDNQSWQGNGTVLLVDDEETVRTICSQLLVRLGLDVLIAEDGQQAVDLYRERKADIDIVMLDLTMPHMDGEESYREMRKINPDVRVRRTWV